MRYRFSDRSDNLVGDKVAKTIQDEHAQEICSEVVTPIFMIDGVQFRRYVGFIPRSIT